REQGEDLGEHLTREVEQGPPAQHPAEGRLTEVEIGRGGDVETALRVQPAGVLDHAGGEVHPGHVQPAFGEVGGDGPGSAADVEDRAEVAHGVGEGVDRRLEPRMAADRKSTRLNSSHVKISY